jgi:hypothetical protein
MFRYALPHQQTEEVAQSIRLDYPLYRWHDRTFLWLGTEVYRSFVDGNGKIKARGRFAGPDLNCGHYFGMSNVSATIECRTCDMMANDVLIRVKASLPNMLDLTHQDTITAVFERLI